MTPPGYDRGAGPLKLLLWDLAYRLLFRPSPRPSYGFRRALLRAFGARLGRGVRFRPSAHVEQPWKLTVGDHSTVGDYAYVLCDEQMTIGAHCMISQRAFLCAGGHDPDDPHMVLDAKPITIGDGVWIAADVFVGPGVEIGDLAVILARSTVLQSFPAGMVGIGSPCRAVRERRIRADGDGKGEG
jgi:putative colanic acid biosynthesis acetyltransferase WcaF